MESEVENCEQFFDAAMSQLGQSRHIQHMPKTNFVRYAPNSDHSTAEFVCRLSAKSCRQLNLDP
jgi:hypothetical protein